MWIAFPHNLPEPAFDDPVDMNAPCQQNSNREAYEQTVAYWTYHFAMSDEKKADPELKARFSSYDGKHCPVFGAKHCGL